MAKTLSIGKFTEKLYSGGYSKSCLNHIIRNQNPSENKKALIKQYLNGESLMDISTHSHTGNKPESILPTATRKVITMPEIATKYPPITDPDTSDFGVAKKFLQVYNSAKERGIEFSLSLTDVKALVKKKKCYYTNLPFDYSDKEKSLTFDRVNSKIGYVKDNVVACRFDVNQLKNILIEHEVSVFKDNPKLLIKCVQKWEIK